MGVISCCSRETSLIPNYVRVKSVGEMLQQELLSATRCRVDYHRTNAGIVALGESLRLIVAERSH